jgi:hypothetical protein
MTLFFGYTVPGLHNESERFRELLKRLPESSQLRCVLEVELDRALIAYRDQAIDLLHKLYSNCRGYPQPQRPPHVQLFFQYQEYVVSLSETGKVEWEKLGAPLLEHFIDPPEGNRNTRNARGISLTFLK